MSDAVLDEAGSLPPADDETDESIDQAEIDAEIDAEVDSFRSFLDDLDPADFLEDEVTDEQSDDDSA